MYTEWLHCHPMNTWNENDFILIPVYTAQICGSCHCHLVGLWSLSSHYDVLNCTIPGNCLRSLRINVKHPRLQKVCWACMAVAFVSVQIFPDIDYKSSLITAHVDTLQERREGLTERFFKRSVIVSDTSCLHYVLPEKLDPDILSKLRHLKTCQPLIIMTARFRKSFVLHCLKHYQ